MNPDPAPEQDPVRLFRQHLGPHLDRQLNVSTAVVALVHAAVTNHGWTPKQLADECSRDIGDTYQPGGLITERLRKAASHPPIGQRVAAFGPKLPFCSPECKDNAGWVLGADLLPAHRCSCRTTGASA